MLTFLVSVAIMTSVVGLGITWAKREERRRMSTSEFDGIEEVLGNARHHQ